MIERITPIFKGAIVFPKSAIFNTINKYPREIGIVKLLETKELRKKGISTMRTDDTTKKNIKL